MNTDKAKQRKRISEYITDHGSITGREAIIHLGILSFTKRISEMRRLDYPLAFNWEIGENQYGEKCRYKRWYFV